MRTIREQLATWVVEEPAGDGLYRKVPLLEYFDEAIEEARAAAESEYRDIHEREVKKLVERVRSLDPMRVTVDRDAVLAILEEGS